MTEKVITEEGTVKEPIAANSIAAETAFETTTTNKEIVEQVIAEKINPDLCEKCGNELHGNLGVSEAETPIGWVILIGETSPRNWICCDGCNVVVCHSCCMYPFSGYCDDCVRRYGLEKHIEEKYGT